MGFERNDEGELDDRKAENIKEEKDDDIRENEDDTIWDKIDWSEDNSKEQSDSIWNEIDWTDDNSGEKEDSIWDEINWNEDESGEKEIGERKNLDDESDAEKNNSNEQQEEKNEEDLHENLNSQSTSTVLVSENIEEIQEVDHDQDELEREIEKELEEGVESINQYLEEAAEFINAYQEVIREARELDGEREDEVEERHQTDEEWVKEETVAYTKEHHYEPSQEEITEINEEFDIEKEAEQSEEVLEPQLSDLQEEFEKEERDEVEQHQIEPLIEEALETEVEPMVGDEEIEVLQEMDLEEQFQTVHDKEYIEELVETQLEMEQLKEREVEAQVDNSKEKISESEEELYEEREEVEQHQVEPYIEEALETEPEPNVNDKEIEALQEMDLEEQFQRVSFNEYIEELVEWQEEEKTQEHDKMEQEKEKIEQNQEILHQSIYLQEELEEQDQELELEYEEKDQVEQHQVEAGIEEELETELKPIINEEEVEYVKNFEPKEQHDAELLYGLIQELVKKQNEEKEESEEKQDFQKISTDEKVNRIISELEIVQKINSEKNSVKKNRDHQQELEEILKQHGKIEQEALIEKEQEEEHSDETSEETYEKTKKLYKQQTGKRPIYANNETKGFKQWLEQRKETEEIEKTEQKRELKEEQKKYEMWKWTLNNRIEEATEIEPELKSVLKKLVEKYNELEKLIKKYSQLYLKAQRNELSPVEKNEFKALIIALQKIDHIKIEMLLGIREIKRYIDEQYYSDFWNKQRHYQVFSHFFTHLAQKYINLKKAQKKNEKSEEILKHWIENASKEEISPSLKAELIGILENYNDLNAISIRFMKLYRKNQKKQISEREKTELRLLIKTLEKLNLSQIEVFTKLRAIKNYLNDKNVSLDRNHLQLILRRFLTRFEQFSKSSAYSLNYTPLTSKQIIKLEKKYQKMLEELCIQYALEFKTIILKEYGKNIMEMNISLTSHFGFQLNKYITKVTNEKVRRAVSVEFLERVKQIIKQKYSMLKNKTTARETSFKKLMEFINGYQEFSSYVSKRFAISRIKYQESSEKLATKSWLIENLRYLFPKKFGLPLSDNLLSWFVFKDAHRYGVGSKLGKHTSTDEVVRHMVLSDLLAIDYRVTKLTAKLFNDKGLKISSEELETLRKSVSYLVYYYIFGGYDESTNVSITTKRGAKVGRNFFTIEYEVIRAIFFSAAEANNGETVGIRAISRASGIPDISVHLRQGLGLGDHFDKILEYFKKLSKNIVIDADSQILKDTKEKLEGYHDVYRVRDNVFKKSQEFASTFQGIVHLSMEDFFGVKFTSEEQLRALLKVKYVTTINDKGVKQRIYIHPSFRFDSYLELTKVLKDHLNLDEKWKGLAIEAMGTYYHGPAFARQQDADKRKRLISKEKNIIVLEIWENWDSSIWRNKIMKQIKEKTGVEIPLSKMGALSKFLGVK